jgi:integrase/recombinase XerD
LPIFPSICLTNGEYLTDADLFCGASFGVLLDLRPNDIKAAQRRLSIHVGKDKKDTYTLLSDRALEALQAYYKLSRPVKWFFEGQYDRKYAERSVQNVFTQAKLIAGINPHATMHT